MSNSNLEKLNGDIIFQLLTFNVTDNNNNKI